MPMWEELADEVYEAAFAPEKWPGVLERLGAATGAASGALLAFDEARPVRYQATDLTREAITSFCEGNGWKTSQRVQHYYKKPFTGFAFAGDYFPPEIQHDESYFSMRKLGLLAQVGTFIPMPSGELVVVALERKEKDGPYPADTIHQLNRLHPHLARSALIAARLGLERAQAAVSTLKALGLPAAVLTAKGRVTASNDLLEKVSNVIMPVAFGSVAISHAPSNKLFQEAILRGETAHDGLVRSIPIPASEETPALVIHLLPLRRSAYDLFSGASMFMVVTRVSASAIVPSPTVLMGLFDLTPAEVKLASALVEGHSLKDAAQNCGIAPSTARSYLERIFAKTGATRQSQLMMLLKSVHPLN